MKKYYLLESKKEADNKIQKQILEGVELLNESISNDSDLKNVDSRYDQWHDFNKELLNRLFSTEEIQEDYIGKFSGVLFMRPGEPPLYEKVETLHNMISDRIKSLKSIKERLTLIPEKNSSETSKIENNKINKKPISNKVFIVHGHDDKLKEATARLIQKLSLEPIILNEQAHKGKTLIEKLESHSSDISFAIILLTPDDVIRSESGEPKDMEFQARQNVILELGYFFGNLGRKNVCVIYDDRVTIPSDFDGMGYIPYDNDNAWKLLMAKELQAAGLKVDLNDL